MFGQTPINITTTRTALLANTGQNHAYFQVIIRVLKSLDICVEYGLKHYVSQTI